MEHHSMLNKIVNKVRTSRVFPSTPIAKRAWIISGAAAIVVVGLAVGTSVSVARTTDIVASPAKATQAGSTHDYLTDTPSNTATAMPTAVPTAEPTVAPKAKSSSSGAPSSSKPSVSTPVTTPKVTQAAPTTSKVVVKPAAPKPAPAPAPPKVVAPAPAPVYTNADAVSEVESHYGGVTSLAGDCHLENYGSWGIPGTPPPPALNRILAGGWLAFSATAAGSEGTVHYYGCYND
jgi:hypothetical protein